MSALTTTTLPVISQGLHQLITAPKASTYGARDDDPGLRIGRPTTPPTPDQVVEARQVLAGYVALQRPTPRLVSNWLFDLNMAVGNTQSPETFEMRAHAIGGLLAEFPAQVFTRETLHDAMRTFEFFPSARELTELLDRHLQSIRDTEAGLRRVAGYMPPAVDQTGPPSDAEKQAVSHMLRAWRGEQADRQAAQEAARMPDKPVIPTLHLSPEHLLAQYEQGEREGNTAAAYRAHHLRQQLAASRGEVPPHPGDRTEGGEHALSA